MGYTYRTLMALFYYIMCNNECQAPTLTRTSAGGSGSIFFRLVGHTLSSCISSSFSSNLLFAQFTHRGGIRSFTTDRHPVQPCFKCQLDRASCSIPAVVGPVYSSLFSVYFIDGGGVSMKHHMHAHNFPYMYICQVFWTSVHSF